MPESDRLNGDSDWIDLEFMERERTPEEIVEVGIHTAGCKFVKIFGHPVCRILSKCYSRQYQLYLAVLSLSNTKQHLEELGVKHSRTAIHNWVQKADLQPTGTRSSIMSRWTKP